MSGKKVLVSGANGFIGAHVVSALLKKGYHVRGTVRSQKRADELYALYVSLLTSLFPSLSLFASLLHFRILFFH